MISIGVILTLLFCHWLADFVYQTDWQAQNKSTNNKALLQHTVTYTAMMALTLLPSGFIYLLFKDDHTVKLNFHPFWFFPITFVCHTVTDYVTSRINTKLYKKNKIHEFFVSVGFDQWLHYVQLFGTYYLMTK